MNKKLSGYTVQDTAMWVTALRSLESLREDRLINDPYAQKLVDASGLAERIAHDLGSFDRTVGMRTKLIDQYLLQAVTEHEIDVVINLGAGMDTRAYRLDLPQDLYWVEADFDDVLLFKKRVLAEDKPQCQLEYVPGDLSDASFRKKLFTMPLLKSKRVLILTEALLLFLSEQVVRTLAQELYAIDGACVWLLESCTDTFVEKMSAKAAAIMAKGEFIRGFGVPADQGMPYFSSLGWQEEQSAFTLKELADYVSGSITQETADQKMLAVSLLRKKLPN